jgi:hypothetical protein
MRTLAVGASLLLALGAPLAAQRADRQCAAAPVEGRPIGGLWPNLRSQWLEESDSVSPDRMRARLSSDFLLLEVISEGVGVGKQVIESRLHFWPEPTYDTTRRIGVPARIIAYGAATTLRSGYLHGVISPRANAGKRFFRVQYGPSETLRMVGVPDSASLRSAITDGPGPWLEVHTFDEDRMAGRWFDAGIAVLDTPTPVGHLAEAGFGYFCTWPWQ